MHIWPLTKLDCIILKLFSWLHTFHNIWSFWNNTSHFEIDAWNFWYINLITMHTSWVFFTLSHTQPLHNSHLNTGYLIAKIQVNLAWNKANTWLYKFNLTSTLWIMGVVCVYRFEMVSFLFPKYILNFFLFFYFLCIAF